MIKKYRTIPVEKIALLFDGNNYKECEQLQDFSPVGVCYSFTAEVDY